MAYVSYLASIVVFAVVVVAVAIGSRPDVGPEFPASEPFSAEQLKQVHDIRDRVSEARGLPVAEDINEGVLTRDELRDFYGSAFDEITKDQRRQLEVQSRAFRLLGLLGSDDDIAQVYTEFGGEGVTGLYLPGEKRLIVIGDQIGYSQELTIAHEYTHSFQDAKYDLPAMQKRGGRDAQFELSTTIPCVYEGDAVLSSVLYMNGRYGLTWIAQVQDEAVAMEAPDIPAGMLRYFSFNYNECVAFAAAVYQKRGWNGINGLYTHPPTTTEQILHVDKYFGGEGGRRIETRDLRYALGPGWKQLEGWAFGEFDVYNYLLTAGVAQVQAGRAAAGWAGGRLELYGSTQPDSTDAVVDIVLQWDTDQELAEFRLILEAAFSSSAGSSVDEVDLFGWSPLGPQAFAVWDTEEQQVEMVFGQDEDALDRVKQAILR